MSCKEREPTELIAGFSVEWKRRLAEYPTAEYRLKYLLTPLSGVVDTIKIDAEADGATTYRASLNPADTQSLDGAYQLIGYVEDLATGGDTVKAVVYNSTLTAEPDPVESDADRRTHARRMVDLLRANLEKLASGTLSSASVNGKTYTIQSLPELRAELSRYEAQVKAEEALNDPDCGNLNNVRIRFNRI